jgi:hypothetical protein
MNANRSNDDDLDALAERLRGLPAAAVPAGLEAKLLAAIPARLATRPRRRPPWLLVAAAAAVLLAFLLGYFFGRTGGPPDQPLPPPSPEIAEEPAPTLWNYRLAQDAPATSSPDPLPSSFEWPVPFTEPVNAHHLPDDLTN